ncbi:MAG: bifunctional DNA-binding transcriptional regulator/O6-methylguanine-DNA methyltransferase Ada [Desulfuromonadales bacterium]|nr:bifunctional DNA-binding transcriptional regulator/O6-methylguanine-DNA methyltransferase Ada [Desulfuromonadales bacterium]
MSDSGKTTDSCMIEQNRWEMLLQRERPPEEMYVYAVQTTGVYCRPGCPSRLPLRKNVRFFDTGELAEQAGFRPCKRCHPTLPYGHELHGEAIVAVCKLLEEAERIPSLKELSESAGISPFHFQRLFKRIVGITPRQYALAKRATRMREQLHGNRSITEAIYAAGFGSGARFYEKSTETLGMQPLRYRRGGEGMRIRYTITGSYLGLVLVACTERGLCAVTLGDEPDMLTSDLHRRFPKAECIESDPDLGETVKRVISLLESPRNGFELPLDIRGTAFQQRVWMALRAIPPGSTVSYGEVAARIGNPRAVRAVATACAANSIAVVIPCHRVVRTTGELAGYRWGIERKKALLEREKQNTEPTAE